MFWGFCVTSRPSTASGTHFQTLSLLLSFSSRVNYPRTERVWLEKIHRLMCRNRRINRVYLPSGGERKKKRPNCIWTTNANPSIEPRNDNDDISVQRRMGVCESHTGAVWQLGRHIKLLTPEAFSRQLIQDFLSFFCPFPLICLFSSVNPRFPTISCDPILWILTILTS